MLPISRRDPVMPPPAARPSSGTPPVGAQVLKETVPASTPGTSAEPQRQQALAKDRQYLSHLSDAYQQMPPEKIEGYGLEDPVKAQVDAEAQAFKDILENIVPEA